MRKTLAAIALTLATLSTAASADDSTYGAIAWSPSTGALGTSYGESDSDYASLIARNNCNTNSNYTATDCEVLTWEGNQYAAVAVRPDGGVMWNTGTNWGRLRDGLLADCAAFTGGTCRIATWVYR